MTAQETDVPGSSPPDYPEHWEADVLLRDGRTAHLRPILPEDAAGLVEFYAQVSPESKYFRFFAPMPNLSDRDVLRFTNVDYRDRVAFVVTLGGDIIAVGRYDVVTKGQAEVAFLVRTPTRVGGSANSCSSTSRRPAGSAGCTGSSPRSFPTTGG